MSTRILTLSTGLLFSLTTLIAQNEVDWRGLTLEEGKPPIAYFPVPFDVRLDTLSTPLGEIPFCVYYAADEPGISGNRLYMVTYYDYPEGTFHKDSTARLAEFFDATQESAAAAVEGELRFADATNSKYPGRVFRVDYGKDQQVAVRNHMYVVGDRYYHQQVFSYTDDGGDKSRQRFFESFQPVPARKLE